MTHVGFFLNVRPGERATGIEQRPFLHAAMLAAVRHPDVHFVVAVPAWFQRQAKEWIRKHGAGTDAAVVISPNRSGLFLAVVDFLRGISEGDSLRLWLHRGRLAVGQRVARFGGRRALLQRGAALLMLAAVPIGLLLALIVGPLLAVATGLGVLALAGMLALARHRLISLARRGFLLSRSERARLFYRRLVEDHIDELVAKVDRTADVGVWLIAEPYAFGARVLRAPMVTMLPSFLPLEDPLDHAHPFHREQHLRVLAMLDRCARVICHSDVVRDRHLVHGAGLALERIAVVAPGRTEAPAPLGGPSALFHERTLRAQQVVRPLQRSILGANLAHAHIDLGSSPFIVYSGDNAPHHHALVLLRALRLHMERGENRPLRLVLRGSLLRLPMVDRWLWNEAPELVPYVIGVEDEVPVNWLALCALAQCAVDPSLFSSGFPDTFGQALCMGTPILMSAIPSITAVIEDPELQRDMLFDPYDARSLLDRLVWALANRETLLSRQRDLFERLPTWTDAGDTILREIHVACERTNS